MKTNPPPTPETAELAPADRAFQSWADKSDSLHLCGSPDLDAMKFAFVAGAEWATRRNLRAQGRADDGEKADESWLATVGFRVSYNSNLGTHLFRKMVTLPAGDEEKDSLPPWLEATITRPGVRIETYGSDDISSRLNNPTRGHVRQLLAALGLPAGSS